MLKIKRLVTKVTEIYVLPNDQFLQYLEKKKAGLAALSEWRHINCLKHSTGEYIRDDILRNFAGQNVEVNNSSNPGLGKDGSQLDVDMDTHLLNNSPPIRKVPGGIISFLFEKFSEANLDDIVDE